LDVVCERLLLSAALEFNSGPLWYSTVSVGRIAHGKAEGRAIAKSRFEAERGELSAGLGLERST
jgi:hypothetical protein